MSPSEYLDVLTQQLRCEKAKDIVVTEISAHIGDQAQAYIEDGMEREQALQKAVEQMGDPVEAGMALDRIHRPKIDWRMLGMIAALSVAGIFLQWLVCKDTNAAVEITIFLKNTVIGIGCMVLISLLDYTIIGKYPRLCILIYCIAAFLYGQMLQDRYNSGMIWFCVPLFAGIIYFYRNEKYKGMIKSLLWICAVCYFMLGVGRTGISAVILTLLAGILILSFAIKQGWYEIPVKFAKFLLASIIIIPAAVIGGYLLFGATYQVQRIQSFLMPDSYRQGFGYSTYWMREILKGLRATGTGMRDINSMLPETDDNYFFIWLMNKFGIVAGVLLIIVLGILFVYMMKALQKQKNRLGVLVGVGGLCGIFFPAIVHILMNVTLLPPTTASLPFFSNGNEMIIMYYAMIGLYLSVYRNSTIAKEPEIKAGFFKNKLKKKKNIVSHENMI